MKRGWLTLLVLNVWACGTEKDLDCEDGTVEEDGECIDEADADGGGWDGGAGADGGGAGDDGSGIGTGSDSGSDGGSDAGTPADNDGDGYSVEDGDCNDEDAAIHPGAEEQCDDTDHDCDGLAYNELMFLRDYYVPYPWVTGPSDINRDPFSVEEDTSFHTKALYIGFDPLDLEEYDANAKWTPPGWVVAYKRDGNLDGIFGYRRDHTLNEDDRTAMIRLDTNSDGIWDEFNSGRFAENWQLEFHEKDYDGDGEIDYRGWYTYHFSGELMSQEEDYDGDGLLDYVYEVTFDDDGNWLVKEFDEDGDGEFDERRTRTYDSDGNWLVTETDEDGDGEIDERLTYTYDSDGNWLVYEADSPFDGDIDRRDQAVYNDDGHMVYGDIDYGADGEIDFIREFERDGEGNATMEQYKYTDAYDGLGDDWDHRITRTFDVWGNVLNYQLDEEADGVWDYLSVSTWVGENLVERRTDEDGDGTDDLHVRQEFDENDRRIRREDDRNADGTMDMRWTFTYTVDGNLIGLNSSYISDWYSELYDEPTAEDVVFTATCLGPMDEDTIKAFMEDDLLEPGWDDTDEPTDDDSGGWDSGDADEDSGVSSDSGIPADTGDVADPDAPADTGDVADPDSPADTGDSEATDDTASPRDTADTGT